MEIGIVMQIPSGISTFYSALASGNASVAASSLGGVEPTSANVAALLPAAQAFHAVDPAMGALLLGDLYALNAGPAQIDHFAGLVGSAEPSRLKLVAQSIAGSRKSGEPPLLFRSKPAVLAAVREALAVPTSVAKGGSSSHVVLSRAIPMEYVPDTTPLTNEDLEFARTLDLGGTWTRDRLLSLARHLCGITWSSRGNSLWLRHLYLAEVCRMTDDEILRERNGIGPLVMKVFKADLARLGLYTAIPIGRIDAMAIGRYALYRAGIVPGSQAVLDMRLDALPEGLPLTWHMGADLLGYCDRRRLRRFVTVRDFINFVRTHGVTSLNDCEDICGRRAGLGDIARRQIEVLGFQLSS
jgi:hypothetical protein